jgi:hypothetical protein
MGRTEFLTGDDYKRALVGTAFSLRGKWRASPSACGRVLTRLFESADIVREAMFRQLSRTSTGTFPQLLKHDLRYKLTRVSGGSMKDLDIVLCQKENDVERVRREIQALLTVIPLVADDEPSSDVVMHLLRLASSRTVAEPSNDGMADLETYYPFVRQLRMSERR